MNLEDSRILLYCVAAGVVLIYLPFLVVGYARLSVGYDMGAPRAMFDKLPDYAKRATWLMKILLKRLQFLLLPR